MGNISFTYDIIFIKSDKSFSSLKSSSFLELVKYLEINLRQADVRVFLVINLNFFSPTVFNIPSSNKIFFFYHGAIGTLARGNYLKFKLKFHDLVESKLFFR